MKIFISHSNRDKALIRELLSYLPAHVKPWLDEEKLLFGMNLSASIEHAIKDDSDFVVLFLSSDSIRSSWVETELCWALDRERKLGRAFVLPVLLDDVWEEVRPKEFQSRKYLKCFDQSKHGVEALASIINAELFAWLSAHLDEENRGDLEEKKKAEGYKKTMESIAEGFRKCDTEVPDAWLQDLRDYCSSIQHMNPQNQLPRLKRRINKMLEKQKELREDSKRKNLKDKVSNPLVGLGLIMFQGVRDKTISTLENCIEELQCWEENNNLENAKESIQQIYYYLGMSNE